MGLFLAGLFCIQCTGTGDRSGPTTLVAPLLGGDDGGKPADLSVQIEHLARTDHIALLERCLANYRARYRDYTCTLVKQENIRGSMTKEQWVQVKFLGAPFSVAMKWVKNAPIGEQVIYVEGKYGDQMLVKPRGWLSKLKPVVLRKPDGPDAMKNTLRPVNQFGFERGLASLLEVYREARKAGELKEGFDGYAEVGGRKTIVLNRYLPPKKDYPAHLTKTYIDLEYLVPVCVKGYDWDGELNCRYIYTDVKLNTGLTEEDFLPERNGMKRP